MTYLLEGEFEHHDSMGNHGVIGPGGVQWMTAGDGIVHSEMPSRRIQTEGGRVHGFQLWVNLRAADKRATPRYQSLDAADLTRVSGAGWTARIVAGSLFGATGPAETRTPIAYAHITLEPGTELLIEAPDDHHAGIYCFAGSGTVGADHEALVLTGEALNEPVARYGPFVMNTRDELIEAVEDYQAGRMGTIAAAGRAGTGSASPDPT